MENINIIKSSLDFSGLFAFSGGKQVFERLEKSTYLIPKLVIYAMFFLPFMDDNIGKCYTRVLGWLISHQEKIELLFYRWK